MQLKSMQGCRLVIGGYPSFSYNANGGGGHGHLMPPDPDGNQRLCFEAEQLSIPSLCGKTTRILGLPLPPGLQIKIVPLSLEGVLNWRTAEVRLNFDAQFRFSVGQWIQAPDLKVTTLLSTGNLQSQRHRVEGVPLSTNGRACLVGVATVQPTGTSWFDKFLGLPDEALAVLECRFTDA